MENHIDFNCDEILKILDNVGSPNMGINFDTGGFAGVLENGCEGFVAVNKKK